MIIKYFCVLNISIYVTYELIKKYKMILLYFNLSFKFLVSKLYLDKQGFGIAFYISMFANQKYILYKWYMEASEPKWVNPDDI